MFSVNQTVGAKNSIGADVTLPNSSLEESQTMTVSLSLGDLLRDEIKVKTSAFAGMAPSEPFVAFGSLNDGTEVVFGLNEGDSINFI